MAIQCDACSFTASCNAALQDHQKRIHCDWKPWKCTFPSCTFRTKGKPELNSHQRTHETNPEVRNPFSCSIENCDYRAAHKYVIVNHVRSKHTAGKTRDVLCTMCPRRFYTTSDLKEHISSHIKEVRFACSQCNFKTHIKSSLRNHVKTVHAQIKKFSCSFLGCNYNCVFKSRLAEHERQVHGADPTLSRPFPCNNSGCNYRASSSSDIRRHHNVHHNPDRKREFPCSLCVKAYYDRQGLMTHIHLVHTSESKYSCEVCKFKTKDKYCLRDHVQRVHVEGPDRERKFKCDSCDYSAYDRGGLRCHESRMHKPGQKYACEEPRCTYRTTHLNNIKTHKIIHDQDPQKRFPIPCTFPHCDFRWGNKKTVKGHEKRHENSSGSQLECKLCDQSEKLYPDKISLEFHQFFSHNKRSFQCKMCPFVAVTDRSLSIHNGKLHGKKDRATHHKPASLKPPKFDGRTAGSRYIPKMKRQNYSNKPSAPMQCSNCELIGSDEKAVLSHSVIHREAVVTLGKVALTVL